jgi:hypothetical protein
MHNESIFIFWVSTPSETEKMAIAKGQFETVEWTGEIHLPRYVDEELNVIVTPYIIHCGKFGPQLVHRAYIMIEGIFGPGILRTNQQIHHEASSVLYGENCFSFSSRRWVGNEDVSIHAYNAFNSLYIHIPGIFHALDLSVAREYNIRAVNRLFNKSRLLAHPEFISQDPFMSFLRQIGRNNAALITNVKLDGVFMTANPFTDDIPAPIGFIRLLKVYIATFQLACPAVQKLTLTQDGDG